MIKRLLIAVLIISVLLPSTLVWADVSTEQGDNHKIENLPNGRVKWTGLPEVEFTEDEITKEKKPKLKWDETKQYLYNEKKYLKAVENFPAKQVATEEKLSTPTPAQYSIPTFEIIADKSLKSGSQIKGTSQQARRNISNKFRQVGDFIWVDGISSGGTIVLPQADYAHVYLAIGSWSNPTIAETTDYQIINGKTHIKVAHFSGGGGVHETGVLQQHIEWEYDDTTFHDRSYYSLSFDGNGDYVNCGNDVSFDITDSITIEAWFYAQSRGQGGFGRLVSKEGGIFFLFFDAVNHLSLNIKDSGAVAHTNPIPGVSYDTWHHVVVTYNGATQRGYLNGVQIGADVDWVDTIKVDASNIKIGNRDANDRSWDGFIDEVRIYNRALGLSEIQFSYNGGVGLYTPYDTTGLVGWWHIEEGSGATIADSSSEGNTGTITGAYWANGHVPLPLGTSGTHNATPSFRLASSDPDVSANLTSFQPLEEAQAPPWVLSIQRDFISDNITASGNFTTTPSPTPPGTAVIEALATASSTPSQLPFIVLTGFGILAISILTSWFLAKYGSRNLWLKIGIITGLMAFAIGVGMFDLWMLLFFVIMATAVALFSRRRSTA